jgi:hypothetical protein
MTVESCKSEALNTTYASAKQLTIAATRNACTCTQSTPPPLSQQMTFSIYHLQQHHTKHPVRLPYANDQVQLVLLGFAHLFVADNTLHLSVESVQSQRSIDVVSSTHARSRCRVAQATCCASYPASSMPDKNNNDANTSSSTTNITCTPSIQPNLRNPSNPTKYNITQSSCGTCWQSISNESIQSNPTQSNPIQSNPIQSNPVLFIRNLPRSLQRSTRSAYR